VGARAWGAGRLCAAAALAAACASASAIVYATGPGSATGDGLRRVRWSQLGVEFLRPGADLRSFRRVLVDPLAFSSSPQGERRGMGPVRQYAPTPDYLDEMRQTYAESFADQFGSGAFALATQPGPGVLRIAGEVSDLVLTARPDPERRPPGTIDLVSSFGELTLVLDVRDAVTGESLLRSLDRETLARDPVMGASANTVGAQLSAQREVFRHLALLLRERLLELQELPRIPEPSP
jgi:hypothetical protein